jgi:superfamily II DNA helicase RecQ
MQDQVAALQAHGVKADYLSSTRTAAERRALLDQLTPTAAAAAAAGSSADRLALLYVTPELLATDRWVDLRKQP